MYGKGRVWLLVGINAGNFCSRRSSFGAECMWRRLGEVIRNYIFSPAPSEWSISNSKLQSDRCQNHLSGGFKWFAFSIVCSLAGIHNKAAFYVERIQMLCHSLWLFFSSCSQSLLFFILTSQLQWMQITQDFWDRFVYCGKKKWRTTSAKQDHYNLRASLLYKVLFFFFFLNDALSKNISCVFLLVSRANQNRLYLFTLCQDHLLCCVPACRTGWHLILSTNKV